MPNPSNTSNPTQPSGIPMAFDDGTQAYVPQERVPDAVKDGGRLVQAMHFDDGSKAWVPLDKVHDAIHDGGQLVLPGVPRPNVNMQKTWTGKVSDAFAKAGSTIEDAGKYGILNTGPMGPSVPPRAMAGGVKGGLQTAHTVATLGTEDTPEEIKAHGAQENIGAGAEGIGEFILGDEALKSLSVAKRLGLAKQIAELAEAHPFVAKLINSGMNAVRTGTVGTVQAAVHGASPDEALKTGAVAGGTGLALEGASGLVKAVAPATKEIAGESIPVRASQSSGLANAGENIAPSSKLQQFDVNRTQPGAKRAIGNVASDIGSKEISGQNLASTAKNLEDRAAQIKAQSDPVFKKLDALTAKEPVKFTDLQKQERAAYRQGDIETANKARAAQDNILDRFKSQFAPDDYTNARANWRQSSALEKAHDALNSKSVVTSTPVKFRPVGTPDPGYIKGKNFANTVLALRDDGTLKEAGLTPKHVQALQDIGTLLEKSSDVHKLHPLIKLVEATAGAAPAGTGLAASRFLGDLMTNEKLAQSVVGILRSGVGPGVASQVASRGNAVLGGDNSEYQYDPDSKTLVPNQTAK